jgi:hypothetical protein
MSRGVLDSEVSKDMDADMFYVNPDGTVAYYHCGAGWQERYRRALASNPDFKRSATPTGIQVHNLAPATRS